MVSHRLTLASFFFLLQFVDLSCQWSVRVVVGGFMQKCGGLGGWGSGGGLVFAGLGGYEILKFFSFC